MPLDLDLQSIKERAYYGSRALLDFDLIQRSQADVLPLIAALEEANEKIQNQAKQLKENQEAFTQRNEKIYKLQRILSHRVSKIRDLTREINRMRRKGGNKTRKALEGER